jgi:hypothetical protein
MRPEAAVCQILEFDALLRPDLLDGADGGTSRLSLALFQFVDRSLSEADAEAEFALAPAEHRAPSESWRPRPAARA